MLTLEPTQIVLAERTTVAIATASPSLAIVTEVRERVISIEADLTAWMAWHVWIDGSLLSSLLTADGVYARRRGDRIIAPLPVPPVEDCSIEVHAGSSSRITKPFPSGQIHRPGTSPDERGAYLWVELAFDEVRLNPLIIVRQAQEMRVGTWERAFGAGFRPVATMVLPMNGAPTVVPSRIVLPRDVAGDLVLAELSFDRAVWQLQDTVRRLEAEGDLEPLIPAVAEVIRRMQVAAAELDRDIYRVKAGRYYADRNPLKQFSEQLLDWLRRFPVNTHARMVVSQPEAASALALDAAREIHNIAQAAKPVWAAIRATPGGTLDVPGADADVQINLFAVAVSDSHVRAEQRRPSYALIAFGILLLLIAGRYWIHVSGLPNEIEKLSVRSLATVDTMLSDAVEPLTALLLLLPALTYTDISRSRPDSELRRTIYRRRDNLVVITLLLPLIPVIALIGPSPASATWPSLLIVAALSLIVGIATVVWTSQSRIHLARLRALRQAVERLE